MNYLVNSIKCVRMRQHKFKLQTHPLRPSWWTLESSPNPQCAGKSTLLVNSIRRMSRFNPK